jgi:hypothetical protein
MNFGIVQTGYYLYPSNHRKELVDAMWLALESAGVDVSNLDPMSDGVTHLELPSLEDLEAFAKIVATLLEQTSLTPGDVKFASKEVGTEAVKQAMSGTSRPYIESRYSGGVTFKFLDGFDYILFSRPVEMRAVNTKTLCGITSYHKEGKVYSDWFEGEADDFILRFRPFSRSRISLH